MADNEWFYCLQHGTVEPPEGCKAVDRLGPYPTIGDAQKALETLHERNKAWDDEDADDADREPADRSDWNPLT